MPRESRQQAKVLDLAPFPEGWYFLTSRKALLKDKLIQKTWMGENIVIWCDDAGQVCVAEAYCAHLGSNLGPAAGGRICDGRLVCPFHGFEYDTTGQCVATPFAPAPKAARLHVFETTEIVGMIFAWWGSGGRAPQWDLPAEQPDQAGWSPIDVWTTRLPGHPQETTENSVDLAHFSYVHGYDSVSRVEPVTVDGHLLRSRFDFRSTRTVAGVTFLTLDLAADTLVSGLGYSYVEVCERSIPVDMRVWILTSPVDGTLIDLSVVLQVREIRRPNRRITGLGFLPPRLRAPIMTRIMAPLQHRDVLQDVVIWSRKKYRPRPRLARSDGEIMAFRAYSAQFYPEPRTVGQNDANGNDVGQRVVESRKKQAVPAEATAGADPGAS